MCDGDMEKRVGWTRDVLAVVTGVGAWLQWMGSLSLLSRAGRVVCSSL